VSRGADSDGHSPIHTKTDAGEYVLTLSIERAQ
jgi:hypothetical protein